MRFKKLSRNIFIRTTLMFCSLLVIAFGFVNMQYWIVFLSSPLVAFLFFDYYRSQKMAQKEIQQFVEAVHYRDFSRHFEVNNAPAEMQPFRSGFNEINSIFKIISKEKETQYLHLKTILDMVDTGILSYETTSGEILWMNEPLKNLLKIPYLKTVHSLQKRNMSLYGEVIALSAGKSIVTTVTTDSHALKLLLSATTFENNGGRYKLIAFQNINEAIDEAEANAWQKLLGVMTHEIMNSVAPISSLAETLKGNLRDVMLQAYSHQESLADIETGILTIQRRSEALLKFTAIYRNLSKIKHATMAPVRVIELFEHVQNLLQPTIDGKKITLDVILGDPLLEVQADAGLVEQVLINLLLNAIDAVKQTRTPKMTLSATVKSAGKINILVSDNGSGIQDEIFDKIFVPFFSTKKTGSGIGLSLCKQIMLLHKGNIQVHSAVGEGTVVTLLFSG